MYAIVETGSKQYKVSKGDLIEVELTGEKKAKEIKLDKVLFILDKKEAVFGRPYIKGAYVMCDVEKEKLNPKVISFRYRRRRANSKRMVGHRQGQLVLKVKELHQAVS